jgi:hypothetical protein
MGTSILIYQLCIKEDHIMGLFGFEVVKAGEGGQKFEKPPSLDLPYVKQRYFLIFFEMANHKTRSFEI